MLQRQRPALAAGIGGYHQIWLKCRPCHPEPREGCHRLRASTCVATLSMTCTRSISRGRSTTWLLELLRDTQEEMLQVISRLWFKAVGW